MTWAVNPLLHEAVNEHGYRIVWAENKHGTWYNAYSPKGTHIEAGYNRDVVKLMCDKHWEKQQKSRAMRSARKAATEVA